MNNAALLRTLPAVRDVEFGGLQVKAMELLGVGIAIRLPGDLAVRWTDPVQCSDVVALDFRVARLACGSCYRPPLLIPAIGQVISFPWTMPEEWVA